MTSLKDSVRRLAAITVLVMAAGAADAAQKNPYLNYTLDKFIASMQTVGRNFSAVTDLLTKRDFEAGKAQLARTREQLAVTITFWRNHEKDDAIKMLRDTLTKMDDLDEGLSAEQIDSAAVDALVKQVDVGCQSCHAVYRDQDPQTKAYRLKPGSIPNP